ncbi:MAG: circularly permuted type 2 ATP-grasp protein [Opitutales bacterium]|nr:circularly permuted type 2 ATP-grasp protein [Opitutales bacterium]
MARRRGSELKFPPVGETDRNEAAYAKIFEVLQSLSGRALRQRRALLERIARELDVHFSVFADHGAPSGDVLVDPVPHIFPEAEWNALQDGVLQRARAFEAFVRDMYGAQSIVRRGVLPAREVLCSPGFHFELAGIPLEREAVFALGSLDVVRTESGEWRVWGQQFANPAGLSHVVQNRRMLAQAFPELFTPLQIKPVASFVSHFAECLREIGERASGKRHPFIVLLSRSETNQAYFDETFLGRQMGFPMVRPADLVIREGAVCLRTIDGLRQVDVIFRRLPGPSMDPVTFPNAAHRGVPGVVHCVRRGSVVIVNALGSGLADDRMFLRYSDRIIRYYLNEPPLLRSVETLYLGDPDQLNVYLDNPRAFNLAWRNFQRAPDEGGLADLDLTNVEALTAFCRARGGMLIARRAPNPEQALWLDGEALSTGGQLFRLFSLHGPASRVLPGGLAQRFQVPMVGEMEGGALRFKDVWVQASDPRETLQLGRLERDLQPEALPLGSRVAESMYWLGRYIERSENTARMLRTLAIMPRAEAERASGEGTWLLWQALSATAAEAHLQANVPPRDPQRLVTALLLDARDPASVYSSVQEAMALARGIREFISPELWTALGALGSLLEPKINRRRLPGPEHADLCGEVVAGVARTLGTARRTLLHDGAWHFFSVGALLERTITTVNVLEKTLPQAVRRQRESRFDDSELTSLLLLTGSLDAYHRAYRSRAFIDRVARLLWQSEVAPNAVLYCLRAIHDDFVRLAKVKPTIDSAPIHAVGRLIEHVRNLPIEQIFPARAEDFDYGRVDEPPPGDSIRYVEKESAYLRESIEAIHELLGDTFFSHQSGEAAQVSPRPSSVQPD